MTSFIQRAASGWIFKFAARRVELLDQRRRQLHAVGAAVGAALAAIRARQPDRIEAGQGRRRSKILEMPVHLGRENLRRNEARHVERDDELPGVGRLRCRAPIGSTTSRPNAAPLSTPASSPIISASPLPLWPPIGSSTPSPTFFGSVIGLPVLLCTTQPSCSGSSRARCWRILPNEDTEVAMSSTTGASLPAGIADRDRIGSHQRLGAAPRRHVVERRHRGIDADHALLHAHLGIDAGGAGMVGIPRADPADAGSRAPARSRDWSHRSSPDGRCRRRHRPARSTASAATP